MQSRKEAWKKFRTSTGFEPVTSRYWCDALTNWAMKPDVGSRSITHNWPAPNVSGFIAQLVRASHWYREVTGSNPVEVLNFFQASLRDCINCVHNCEDQPSFDFISAVHIWFISYTSFTFNVKFDWNNQTFFRYLQGSYTLVLMMELWEFGMQRNFEMTKMTFITIARRMDWKSETA